MSLKRAFTPFIPPAMLSGLQHLKAELSIRRFSPRVARHTYGAHQLTVHLHDPMSASWYDRDWRQPKEFELLETSRLKSGALVFDIGAHQCVVAMLLARKVGPGGRVIAVEPNPFNVRLAEMNIRSNNIENITVLESMLSTCSTGGFISFQLNAVAKSAQSWGRRVQSITLADLVNKFGTPAVIYLDIEGFESEVLNTADDLLEASIDWCVELHGDDALRLHGSSNIEIVEKYLAKGFRVSVITEQTEIFEARTKEAVPRGRCHIVALKA